MKQEIYISYFVVFVCLFTHLNVAFLQGTPGAPGPLGIKGRKGDTAVPREKGTGSCLTWVRGEGGSEDGLKRVQERRE